MSSIPQPSINPAFDTSNKPFTSTNRSSRASKDFFSNQVTDSAAKSLEAVPDAKRGSRSKPSVLKYPVDLGDAQVPHAMQFKIFWRWEAKDLRSNLQNAKAESEKKIGNLSNLANMIDGGNASGENVSRNQLSGDQIAALSELKGDEALKTVDPASGDSIATLLQTNPERARQVLEQSVQSEQTRLSSIEAELNDGAGKIGLDERERLQVQNRLAGNVESNSVTGGLLNSAAYSGVGGLLAAGAGLITGSGLKGALSLGAKTFAGGMAVGAAAVGVGALAKAFKTEAEYDQMVSVYLPFCNKINNEDAFVYEDSNQAVGGAFFDAMGGELAPTAGQGVGAAVQLGMDKYVPGAAGAVQAARGTVVNPRLEKLFKQKEFRNFNFSWEFYPRSRGEVDAIRDIIETFRYHAHPALSEGAGSDPNNQVQIMLRTPAEFEIRFLSSNSDIGQAGFVENEFIPKIGRCVLNNISVDYTPNSIYSSFKDNSPTAVTFTLSFSENGLLTRETVDKGF